MDIRNLCHGDRVGHYSRQFGAYDAEHTKHKLQLMDLAWKAATAEMLDEIHAMLLTTTQDKERG